MKKETVKIAYEKAKVKAYNVCETACEAYEAEKAYAEARIACDKAYAEAEKARIKADKACTKACEV